MGLLGGSGPKGGSGKGQGGRFSKGGPAGRGSGRGTGRATTSPGRAGAGNKPARGFGSKALGGRPPKGSGPPDDDIRGAGAHD